MLGASRQALEEPPKSASQAVHRLPARWSSDRCEETDPTGLLPIGTVGRLARLLSVMSLLRSLRKAGPD